MTVNLKRSQQKSWGERLMAEVGQAEKLVRKSYGDRGVEALKLREKVENFVSSQQFPVAQALGIFVNPEMSAYAAFSKSFPELCVVSDSFHIKPFIYNDWQRPVFGVFVTHGRLEFYLVNHFEIVPQGAFGGIKEFLGTRKLGAQSIFVFAENRWGQNLHDKAVEEVKSRGFRIVETGAEDRQVFLSQLPNIAKAQHYYEEQSFLRHAKAHYPLETPSRILSDLKKSPSRAGTFASSVINPLWGKIHRSKLDISMYEQQFDAEDDCIVDDLYEIALQKNMNTLFVDPGKWDLPTPFVFNKSPNKPLKEEVA